MVSQRKEKWDTIASKGAGAREGLWVRLPLPAIDFCCPEDIGGIALKWKADLRLRIKKREARIRNTLLSERKRARTLEQAVDEIMDRPTSKMSSLAEKWKAKKEDAERMARKPTPAEKHEASSDVQTILKEINRIYEVMRLGSQSKEIKRQNVHRLKILTQSLKPLKWFVTPKEIKERASRIKEKRRRN